MTGKNSDVKSRFPNFLSVMTEHMDGNRICKSARGLSAYCFARNEFHFEVQGSKEAEAIALSKML